VPCFGVFFSLISIGSPGRTPEDLVMQLLVLKMLYILFNTKGLSEYFYTNDLCVLVDVFLREIVDLDEESESVCYYFDCVLSSNLNDLQLRHTYLRVLHPLLTKTQLRSLPYKRTQIVRALESLIANQEIREVSSTIKRLVERCLTGEWCVQHRASASGSRVSAEHGMQRSVSPSSDRVAAQSLTPKPNVPAPPTTDPSLFRRRSLKGSRSAENLRGLATADAKPASRTFEAFRKPTNDSSLTLAIASSPPTATAHPQRTSSETLADKRPSDRRAHPPATREIILPHPIRHGSFGTVSDQPISPAGALSNSVPLRSPPSPLVPASARTADPRVPPSQSPAGGATSATASGTKKVQRRSPPPPPKRRKPPAVPMRVVGKSNGGADIAAIASSTSSLSLGKSRKT
jgi:SPIN90/Ldb17